MSAAPVLSPMAAPRPRAGSAHTLTGTGALLRFDLRRSLIVDLIWCLALIGSTLGLALAFVELYRTPTDRQIIAQTMGTPAGLAFTGPAHYFDDYTLGSVMSHQMLGFMGVAVGIMTIMTITRHTRSPEETGQAELIRAGVVGRHAPLAAAVCAAVLLNAVIGLGIAVGLGLLGIESMDWPGSVLYGAAHLGLGIAFIGVGALAAQFAAASRTANEIGIGVVLLAYLLRASGDAGDTAAAWFSPIGWMQRTYPYLDDDWAPLLLCLGCGALLTLLAGWLSTRRDLAAGLLPARRGRRRATPMLLTPLGLVMRLQRTSLLAYGIGIAVLGAMYGPFLGDLGELIGGVDALQGAIASIGGASVLDSFLTMVMTILAILAGVCVITAVLRMKGEETAGRAEALLANRLSRTGWMGWHLIVAVIAAPVLLVLGAAAMAALGAHTVEESGVVGKIIGAALVYTPALWVLIGLAALAVGWAPRLSILVWAVLVWAGVAGYFGPILQLEDWTERFTPFGYVPKVPVDDLDWWPLIVLTGIAAVCMVLGLIGYRRRDLRA